MGRGPLWACLEYTLCSTISSPSWDQPLGLEGCSPISQIHSQSHPSLVPSIWKGQMDSSATPFPGEQGLSPQTSPPPVVTYLCRCSVSAAQSSSLGKVPKASGWSLVPASAPPVLAPSAAAPSSSRPPGQPPPSLPPAHPVLCLFSENQTRDWGEGEDPRRGSGI